MVLICVFLQSSGVDPLFIYLTGISPFMKYLVNISHIFINWLACLIIELGEFSLINSDKNSLLGIYFANIFFKSLAYLFIS